LALGNDPEFPLHRTLVEGCIYPAQARMLPLDLDPAISFCTHLVYASAGIQPDTYKMVPLNENLDVDNAHANYRTITNFKQKYPGLKVLISVGGDADTDSPEKYNLLVRSSIWHGVKKTFGTTPVDDKETEHREGFTALVRELKQALNVKPNLQLCLTVLPNVNSTIYYDVPAIINLVDIVNLDTYDYNTPERNPKEADYTSPIYMPQNRNPELNTDAELGYWLKAGAPSHKIVIGIPTFARTWKLDSERTYAFRLHDSNTDENGIWVSYEDPDTAGQKAVYAKSKNLGGVSINDLSMDDFRGLCTGDKYPILRAAKYRLN
ncbi:Hemocyte aggregation inhibitor protein, partial [Operophtera brumata]